MHKISSHATNAKRKTKDRISYAIYPIINNKKWPVVIKRLIPNTVDNKMAAIHHSKIHRIDILQIVQILIKICAK